MVKNILAAGVLAVCCAVVPASNADAAGSAVSALPADALMLVKVTKLKETYDKLMASPPGQLIHKGEFKELLDRLKEEFEKARAQVRAELDVDLWEALQLIEGELLFFLGNATETYRSFKAISEAEGDENKDGKMTDGFESLPFLVIGDAETGSPKLKEVLGKLKSYIGDKGALVESADFHGGQITTIRNKGGAGHGYVGEKDSRFVVGFNRKLVEQTMVNLGGATASGLSTNAIYQATHREVKGGSSDFFAYLNVKQVIDAVGPAIAGEMPAAMIWEQARGLLFGNSLNSLGMAGALDKDGMRQTTFVHNDGASDGILGWFKGATFPSTPPSVVPAEAGTFSTIAFNAANFGNFVRSVAQIGAMFQGGGGGEKPDVNAMAKAFIGVELDEFLRALGSRLHFFGSAVAPSPDNPFGDQTIAIELSDEGTMKTVVETLKNFAPFEDKEYLGSTIYRTGESGPAFSVTNRMFVVSFAPGGIEKLIRRMGAASTSLGDSTDYKRLAASVPSSVSVLSYMDSKYVGNYLDGIVEMVMNEAPEEIPQEAFLFLTALGRTLGASIGFGTWLQSGMYFESLLKFQAGN